MLEAFFAVEPGFSLKKFKSLGDVGFEIDRLARINVVIGKNNSGKSAILDAIALLCESSPAPQGHHHAGERPVFSVRQKISEPFARQLFQKGHVGNFYHGDHWDGLGLAALDSWVSFNIDGKNFSDFKYDLSPLFNDIKSDYYGRSLVRDEPTFQSHLNRKVGEIVNPFAGIHVVKVAAERDLVREAQAQKSSQGFSANGSGITAFISNLCNSSPETNRIVEQEFRSELNKVLEPDISISSFRVFQDENNAWEIHISGGDRQLIPLSNSGSGLKTIFHTLAALWLRPRLGHYDVKDTIFLLEELENNLHPALQRRLLRYIAESVRENGCVFLATHSNVVIDMFNTDDDAKIIHVTNIDGVATGVVAHTTISHGGIIDDLDVRASDILQSNCIVWVEGPSDRLYFNRWMTLFSEGAFTEGVHYQCLFYGGRLLSHLSAEHGEEEQTESIRILRANRHAILLIDSDRSQATDPINATKQRVMAEIESINGYAWITDGREIENDIAPTAFAKLDQRLANGLKKFDEVEKVLQARMQDDAKPLVKSKAVLAGRLAPLIELQDMSTELRAHITECARLIRRWNGMPPA